MRYFSWIILIQFFICLGISGIVKCQPIQETLSIEEIVPGYKKIMQGNEISFHSSNPDVTEALIARNIKGNNEITWKTAIIPEEYNKKYIYFIWLAGLATGDGRQNSSYDLLINGENVFAINIRPGEFPQNWTQKRNKGFELSFIQHSLDDNKDAFGYMYLKVPVAEFEKGKPLVLKMIGEKNSRYDDWYMTFKHEVKEELTSVQSRQLLRKTSSNKLQQLVAVNITHKLPKPANVKVRLDNFSKQVQLNQGSNHLKFWIPAVKSKKKVTLNVDIPQIRSFSENVVLQPVKHREVYLINHSHIDIGYSDLQPEVIKKHNKYIRQAMELIDKSKNYPPDARYIYNIEALWAVENFLKQATSDEKKKFIKYVKAGSIGLSAGYANILTGLCRPEELIHLTDYSKKLEGKYGINSLTFMTSDVPGMSWNMVPTLAERGIRYISSGPNYIPHPGFPDKGARVGDAHRVWGDNPFYWVSASKQDTVLYWQAGKGYSWAHPWNAGRLSFGHESVSSLLNYMEELREDDYPYEMVQLRYSILNDNAPPDTNIADFVASWNKKYESPKLINSQVEKMMKKFEQRYGDSLPTFSGDFTPYWEDGAMSTAKEEVLVKRSTDRLYQSSILNALLWPGNYNKEKYYRAWRDVILWHEHSWGAGNSVTQPDNSNVIKQWEYKQSFALQADSLSRSLLAKPLDNIGNREMGQGFNVINTSSWRRTGTVFLTKEQSASGDVIEDKYGKKYPSQRLSDGRLAFMAQNIPSLGSKTFYNKNGKSSYKSDLRISDNVIENKFTRLELDENTGAIKSLINKQSGQEFVNNEKHKGLNQYIYVPGRNPDKAISVTDAQIKIKENGPLISTFEIRAKAPGTRTLMQEISLINEINKISIKNKTDKEEVREKESVHFAFPIGIQNGELKINLGTGVLEPNKDQLQGANKDFISMNRWADISNSKEGITIITNEVSLLEVGELVNEVPVDSSNFFDGLGVAKGWKSKVPHSTTFFSYVMNNYWFTNYKASQKGPVTFNYSIYLHDRFDPAAATRKARADGQPLLVTMEESKGSLPFQWDNKNILLTSAEPANSGKGIKLRLFNASAKPEKLDIQWDGQSEKKIYLSNYDGDRLEQIDTKKPWAAFAMKTLYVGK